MMPTTAFLSAPNIVRSPYTTALSSTYQANSPLLLQCGHEEKPEITGSMNDYFEKNLKKTLMKKGTSPPSSLMVKDGTAERQKNPFRIRHGLRSSPRQPAAGFQVYDMDGQDHLPYLVPRSNDRDPRNIGHYCQLSNLCLHFIGCKSDNDQDLSEGYNCVAVSRGAVSKALSRVSLIFAIL